jgi:hypothetical protein
VAGTSPRHRRCAATTTYSATAAPRIRQQKAITQVVHLRGP